MHGRGHRNSQLKSIPVKANRHNYTFRTGTVPSNWLIANVTQVIKVTKPQNMCDFRPISVTLILSRLAEKILVLQLWIRPAFTEDNLSYQFAFKSTGSTNFACTNSLFGQHRQNARTNNYVRCLTIDFAKAFDMVDNAIVSRKVNVLNMPASIKICIIHFLTA